MSDFIVGCFGILCISGAITLLACVVVIIKEHFYA